MDTTRIVMATDLHLTDRQPRARRDDYTETQFRKLSGLLCYAEKVSASAVALAGDFFDIPVGRRISRHLDSRLITLLKSYDFPVFVIYGNHDLEHGRTESLRDHPLGVLEAAHLLIPVGTCPHVVRSQTGPSVLVLGFDYKHEGPLEWLRSLKKDQSLLSVKARTSCVAVLGMTHCFWGSETGQHYGDPVVGYGELTYTGFNVMLAGHDHSYGGLETVEGCTLVRPGALVRGSLAEEDINRIPCIALATFYFDGLVDVEMVPVLCRPASEVFDLEKHAEEKNIKNVLSEFTTALKGFGASTEVLDPLGNLKERVTPQVAARVDQYIEWARVAVSGD